MPGIVALTFAYVLSQFYRSFLAVLSPALIVDLGASKAQLSMASGAWFFTFAMSQFVVGVSLDRFGPRRTAATLLAVFGGSGAFLLAIATQPWMAIVAMALIGVGCSPVLMGAVYIFAHRYPPARLAVLTSVMVGIGSAGNVVGASPLANAAELFGWRGVIAALGVITLAIAACAFALVRDPVRSAAQSGATGFAGYGELLRVRALWPLFPLAAVNTAAAVGIRGLWAGPYLADVYGATSIAIGQVTLFMALAMVAGNFIYGPLDTIFGTRKWVMVGGNVLSVIAVLWLTLHPGQGLVADTVVLMVIGCCGANYGLMMAHARPFLPPHLTGRGMTLMNFFCIGGIGIMQLATGAVVTAATEPGDPHAAYTALFLFYAAVLGTALSIYLFSRDARPNGTPSPEPIAP